MNNPIVLRGSQAMINEIIKNNIKFVSILKWLLGLSILGFLIHFPDVIAHGIVWLVHTFYEATSFLLEEFLRHSFGIDKPLAQLIVFYFSIVVGIGAVVLFWRYWLREYLVLKFYAYQQLVIYYWHSKQALVKPMLIYFALIVSAFMFLLT